ncbi:MAG: PA14 domain-containing protein, partial [Gemmataceae bacterium]
MPRIRLVIGLMLLSPVMVQSAQPDHPIVPGFERFYSGEKAGSARAGHLLIRELSCGSCHKGSDDFAKKQGPILNEVGTRARVASLRKFLGNPQAAKPGTLMPNLFGDDPEKDRKIEALVHLLASTGTPRHERPNPQSVGQGRDLYHRVGCVACHGTRNAQGDPDKTLPTSVPLGPIKDKYTITSLTTFLLDPLHSRPSGRMPRLLHGDEAKAVASFLLQGANIPLIGKGSTRFEYYEGGWDRLPDFKTIQPIHTGKASGFDLGVARRGNNFALRFEGFWKIDHEEQFQFVLSSDDGSRLMIDDAVVVDNDGIHAHTQREGSAKLRPGIHKVSLAYFQGGGEISLDVKVRSPRLGEAPLGDLIVATKEDLANKSKVKADDPDRLEIRPEMVEEGKQLFTNMGCANCHQLTLAGRTLESTVKAPEGSALTPGKGCLADAPSRGLPNYGLSESQRKAIAVGITEKPPARGASAVVSDTMLTFNCYACHVRDKIGGPEEDLNKTFLTTQPEMGDEGRLPPPLDGVGAKLATDYFRNLLDRGADDRPYMHTRMPGFGQANAGKWMEATQELDKLPTTPTVDWKESMDRVKAQGRHLVGGLALGCIKCHTFNGVRAEGVQGIDMTLMPRRLKRDWFHAYIADPPSIRPGTRMPSSFQKGKSVLPDILDGTALQQIESMWQFLGDGGRARLPAGMGQVSIPLMPTTSAIVYRGFIEGGGTRAIGVGYPEKNHLVFDAADMRMAMLWQG